MIGRSATMERVLGQVRRYLRDHGDVVAPEEIAMALDLPVDDVRTALAELHQDGLIEDDEDDFPSET